jgi:4-diphosphocytidyl-2-C-methyl-D-erythritol kinase
MVRFPKAKINLGLQVKEKRADGYHEIESVLYPIPLFDALEALPANDTTLSLYGLPIPGDPESNLCLKAVKLLQTDYSIPPVQINLLKRIPMGAGLGGGSSDAAMTLTLLNDLFTLGISKEGLRDYAAQLGSDCPFFIDDAPQRASGRGEQLAPFEIDLSGHWLVLIHPGVHVSTADAYAGLTPQAPTHDLSESLSQPVSQWHQHLVNDFESFMVEQHAEVQLALELLKKAGASYAAMTGSGSSVFGLFATRTLIQSSMPTDYLPL